jgi:hypothetical protein
MWRVGSLLAVGRNKEVLLYTMPSASTMPPLKTHYNFIVSFMGICDLPHPAGRPSRRWRHCRRPALSLLTALTFASLDVRQHHNTADADFVTCCILQDDQADAGGAAEGRL